MNKRKFRIVEYLSKYKIEVLITTTRTVRIGWFKKGKVTKDEWHWLDANGCLPIDMYIYGILNSAEWYSTIHEAKSMIDKIKKGTIIHELD